MKRPGASKNPERPGMNKAVGRAANYDLGSVIIKGAKAVSGYLNKVSGAAMFDKGGKYDNQSRKGKMPKKR